MPVAPLTLRKPRKQYTVQLLDYTDGKFIPDITEIASFVTEGEACAFAKMMAERNRTGEFVYEVYKGKSKKYRAG